MKLPSLQSFTITREVMIDLLELWIDTNRANCYLLEDESPIDIKLGPFTGDQLQDCIFTILGAEQTSEEYSRDYIDNALDDYIAASKSSEEILDMLSFIINKGEYNIPPQS